jgi:ATP-dependent Clp protease ATP-binding subunit ClpX
MSSPPTPAEIARELSGRVIGQAGAVREMSIALAKHLAGLPTGNILMIGSSGTGKTTLLRAVEKYLRERPELGGDIAVVRLHANVLAEEARAGRPGSAVLGRLADAVRDERLRRGAPLVRSEILRVISRGIVFVDEVDKIRSQVGDRPNVDGIRAQEALLTLIENEAIPFEVPEWLGGGREVIDSSSLLFVCAGAFEGLYDAVYDRVTIGKDRGSLQPVNVLEAGKVRQAVDFELRDWLRNEDLFEYGMSPQFLSRFDAVVLLGDLGVEELLRIFHETPDSGLVQSRAYFQAHGVRFALSPAAARAIASEAARQPRLGARALKEAFRRVMRDHEFEPVRLANQGVLLIDEDQVKKALANP